MGRASLKLLLGLLVGSTWQWISRPYGPGLIEAAREPLKQPLRQPISRPYGPGLIEARVATGQCSARE